MGNCFTSSSKGSSSNASGPSKVTSKISFSDPSTLTCSTPSTLTVPSYTERSAGESLPAKKTEDEILSSSKLKAFTFSVLKNATRNFSRDSLIGEGGFGYVYKGWLDEQSFAAARPGYGMPVAVKMLKPESFQGHKEWLTEVNYLGQIQHPNLVKLIGYCSDGDVRLLVYEFMPKGSLENYIFKRAIEPLSWALRIKIASEAARGLSFLHDAEPQVIYRDVKASNVLLDMEFNAKLSDFGLAKDGPTGDRTHVSTQVMGTHGYAAPEYIATGRLSAKADVYGFGVLLLELLSGRRAIDKTKVGIEQNLVDWAKPWLSNNRKIQKIMDPRLEGQYPKKAAHEVASLSLQCLSNEAKSRPQMSQVLATLEQLLDLKDAAKLSIAAIPVTKSPVRHQPSPHHPKSGGAQFSSQQSPLNV